MSGNRHLRLGEEGEEMAAAYLRERGLKVLARRVRLSRGELDIVARDGPEWIFVEVKTRSAGGAGRAVEAMGARKSLRMGRAVREYVNRHHLHDAPIRCDLVAVDIGPDGLPDITHYPGAIVPG